MPVKTAFSDLFALPVSSPERSDTESLTLTSPNTELVSVRVTDSVSERSRGLSGRVLMATEFSDLPDLPDSSPERSDTESVTLTPTSPKTDLVSVRVTDSVSHATGRSNMSAATVWKLLSGALDTPDGILAELNYFNSPCECLFAALKRVDHNSKQSKVTLTLTNLIVTLTLTLQLIIQANEKLWAMLRDMFSKREDVRENLDAIAGKLKLKIYLLTATDEKVSLLTLPNSES